MIVIKCKLHRHECSQDMANAGLFADFKVEVGEAGHQENAEAHPRPLDRLKVT